MGDRWFEQYPSLVAAAFGLMLAWLWARAAVAAWRATLPPAVGAGCGVGVAAGVCGLALAVPSVWEREAAVAPLAAGLSLGSTLGPGLALWGLSAVWRDLEAPAESPGRPRDRLPSRHA